MRGRQLRAPFPRVCNRRSSERNRRLEAATPGVSGELAAEAAHFAVVRANTDFDRLDPS